MNAALYTTANMRGQLLPGKVSDALDQAGPSRRLRLEDETPTGATHRAYLSVIVPYPSTRRAPPVRGIRIDVQDDRAVYEFAMGEREFGFVWDDSGLGPAAPER